MSMGFVHIGTLKEVGRKFDRLIDIHISKRCWAGLRMTNDKLLESGELQANRQPATRNL